MARLILIKVEDNEEADKFMAALKEDQVIFGRAEGEEGAQLWRYGELKANVEAVWGTPTKFCECPDSIGSARTKNLGWWVHHPGCGKPRPGQHQNPIDLTRKDMKPAERPYYINFYSDLRGFAIGRESKK